MKQFRVARHLVHSALHSLRNAWYLHLAAIGTIATATFIVAGTWLLFSNVQNVLVGTQGGPHISVYIRSGSEADVRTRIKKGFCSNSYIRSCEFRSKRDAIKKFADQNPDLKNSVQALSANPFPASMEISIRNDFDDLRVLKNFSRELETLTGVESVDSGGEWLDRWISVMRLANWLIWTLIGLASLAMMFVVSNTIALIVYARRDEVEILNLVGATDFQIRIPFVLEGLLHGALGSALALGFLRMTFQYVRIHAAAELQSMILQSASFLTLGTLVSIVGLGILVGVAGSSIATGRFLRS